MTLANMNQCGFNELGKCKPKQRKHGIIASKCMISVISTLKLVGTSLVVPWIRLRSPNAGGPGSIPGQETRSLMHATTRVCMPQLESLRTATKEPKSRN